MVCNKSKRKVSEQFNSESSINAENKAREVSPSCMMDNDETQSETALTLDSLKLNSSRLKVVDVSKISVKV